MADDHDEDTMPVSMVDLVLTEFHSSVFSTPDYINLVDLMVASKMFPAISPVYAQPVGPEEGSRRYIAITHTIFIQAARAAILQLKEKNQDCTGLENVPCILKPPVEAGKLLDDDLMQMVDVCRKANDLAPFRSTLDVFHMLDSLRPAYKRNVLKREQQLG